MYAFLSFYVIVVFNALWPNLMFVWTSVLHQVQSVLGLELLECLYWRRGALLYMYCHTLHQRKQWIKKNKATFLKVLFPISHSTVPIQVAMIWVSITTLHVLQCLQEGVRYLMRMLQVRNSVKLNDGVVFHDSATANFLAEGTCCKCNFCFKTQMIDFLHFFKVCAYAIQVSPKPQCLHWRVCLHLGI